MKKLVLLVSGLISLAVYAQSTNWYVGSSGASSAGSVITVVPFSEVKWEPLNPARGDQSPQAGTLWGDRNGALPTGFIARFRDGFSSPPHIHNVTYRAVVISGLIHNDDPGAAELWMPAGSFWTQPGGEVHITAAKGEVNLALVEIDRGPYLVIPVEEAFDSDERPINVDASNLVWVDMDGTDSKQPAPKIAYLWGSLQDGLSHGSFIRLPANFAGTIRAKGATFRAVVVSGALQYSGEAIYRLTPGSYFGSSEASSHEIEAGDIEVVLYIRTDGKFELASRN